MKIDASAAASADGTAGKPSAKPADRNESSPIELRLTRSSGKPSSVDKWDQAVARSRDAWLYHRSNIVEFLATSHGQSPIFVECYRSDEMLGGAILTSTQQGWHGLPARRQMRGVAGSMWVSPLVVDGLDAKTSEIVFERLLDECIAVAKSKHCDELALNDCNQSLRCIEDRPQVNRYVVSTDWKHSASYFWLLDLRPDADALWKNVAASQRTQIKNARAKLQVVCGTELQSGREMLIELMGHVHRREGISLADANELSGYWKQIYSTEFGRAFFCMDDGKPCTVAGVARLGKVASYVHAGRTDDAMNGAAALSLWSGIEWAKSVGCEWFDLNSMIPERDRHRIRAVSQFKKRFGGEVIVANGASMDFARATKSTCTFIDAWGAEAKNKLCALAGKGNADPDAVESVDDAATASAVHVSEKVAEPKWEVAWRSPGPTSPDEWDAVVESSRETWLYHLSRLAPLFLPPGADPLTFLELRLDGTLVGGAIFDILRYRWHGLHDQKYLRGQIGPQTVSPFLASNLNEKLVEAAWDRLLDGCMAAARDMGCLDLTLWDAGQSPRTLEDREIVNRYRSMSGWSPLLTHHYFLDLSQDIEALFKNVQSRRRTYIRRAREQFQVVKGREFPGGREAHIELMEAVYRREGKVVVARDRLLQIWDAVYNGEYGEAFFCLEDGKPITFTGISRFRNVASYLHGGRVDETQHGAHALGFWSGVEWAKAAGCRWFDCNAATFEKRGRERMRHISEFKRGFGGSLIQVHGAKRAFRPLARASYEFVDAWGVQCKKWLGKLNPFHR